MTTIKAIIQGGRLELEAPSDWPDGTEVEIHRLDQGTNGTHGAPMDRESWRQFIEKTAGSITDPTFERHSQGEFEEREQLP
jgi:hypothetical protein